MNRRHTSDGLTHVVLVAPCESDTFDDPPEDFLNFRSLSRAMRVVVVADKTRIGSASSI